VGLLTLYSGLLLPWLGGVLWLAFADARFNRNNKPNRFRLAGYGFFLGYAVLFMAIMASDKLTGTVSWPGLMVFLLVFATSGGIAVWRSPTLSSTTHLPSQTILCAPIKAMTGIMMVLMAIHLVFIATEIFTQPVYPWDAWLAWVYRAKAWFLAGAIVDVVSTTDWATATSANIYTIDAFRYPLFPSVVPYWAALSLGSWSETLVNLPVLFAGLALGMAIYGQCREHGLSIAASLIALYLLYSIPLLGAHLAQAGYADIWMAGFTGLGFIAVIRGAIKRENPGQSGFQIVLGILMILFSMWVKNEGAVWFLAALAMLILATCRPRVPILMMVAVVLVALLTFAVGFTYIDIPLIGNLGIVNGRLAIPFIGNFALEVHNIQHVYWDNFINMGSWNLFWVMVTASLILGFKSPNLISGYRARRTALSFILVFLTTQLFIFGFTDQGLWADTYTAINRLPLHFVPALLFAVVVIANASLTQPVIGSGRRVSRRLPPLIAATLLSLITVAAGTITYLSKNLPTQSGETLNYPAADFKFAFGSGLPISDRVLVDRFENGYALLSSGPVNFQADTQRVLSYTWLPPKLPQEAAFFWRRSDDIQNVLRTEITLPGAHFIDLATEPDWHGEITEFGFLVAGVNGEAVEIGDVSLLPDKLSTRLNLTWRAWTTFEEWSQQSINFLYGGDYRQVVALPLLVAAWLLLTILLLWLFTRLGESIGSRQLLIAAGLVSLLAWVMLDIRWSANNIRQIKLSFQNQLNTDDQQRSSIDLDGEIYQYVQRLKSSVLGDQSARILIIGDENAIDYYLLRAKYHLLPHSVNVAGRLAKELTPESLDFVIFFGQSAAITKVPGWKPFWQKSLARIDQGEWGTVYRVE
jgi:hypothetical protein